MKKLLLILLFILSLFCYPTSGEAASNFYGATSLIGSATGSLDSIDGTNLATGDGAYVITSTAFYIYYLDAASGAAESSPDVISPDSNAENKRWLLMFEGTPDMADVAQLAVTDGNFIVGNGTTWVAESGATARTSMGVGTTDSPTFAGETLTGNQTITKADPAIILDSATATDTDFWMGVTEDAGGDDDDKFQIGDGATPGTNPFVTVLTDGKVGIGTDAPAYALDVFAGVNGAIRVFQEVTPAFYSILGSTGTWEHHRAAASTGGLVIKTNADSWGAGGGFIDFYPKNSNKMRLSGDGYLGINTTTPDTLLELSQAAADTEATISTYHDTEATSPVVTLRKADGVEAVPAAVDDNAVLGTVKFKGYDGNSWANGAYIQARVDGTPADGSMPTEVAIATSADGAESPTEKLSAGPNTVNILSGLTLKKTNVSDANYGTSAITSDYIVAFTSLTAARTATISTEDEDSGTATQPRVMIFKDESGSAATYNITISLESGGTIDGAANFVIDQPYQSVTIYLNGSNGYIF